MIKKDAIILKYLIDNKGEEANILSISKELNMDYKNVHNIIKRLEIEKCIKIETFGKSKKIILNNTLNPTLFEAETLRKEIVLKNKKIELVLDYFSRNLKTKLYVLLLFGSHAKKTTSKNSDMDLLFIVSDESIEKSIHNVASMIPLDIHLNIFTEEQFLSMKNSKEKTIGSEAILHNIILHGIDSYYRLIE